MNKKFETRFEELKKKIPDDLNAKIAEIANRQTEEQDYSKKRIVVWSQIFATLSIALVGGLFTFFNHKEQEQNRNSQTAAQEKSGKVMMATQLMSNREKSETDFRQAMFLPLINQVLDDKLPLEKRFTVFQIFQNNFNDLFNSRALFDVLDEAATQKINHRINSVAESEIHNRLISLARKTNQDQAMLIGGEQEIIESISQGDSITKTIGEMHGTDKDHNIKIMIDSITKEYVIARMILDPGTGKRFELNNGNPIRISYFDSPLTDNILLSDKHRIAVTLEDIFEETGYNKAKLKIIHFPAEFITTGYRPSVNFVQEMLDDKPVH